MLISLCSKRLSSKADHKLPTESASGPWELSPPTSPYPGRPAPLASKVEADLRLACAAVIHGLIPSEIDLAPVDDEEVHHRQGRHHGTIGGHAGSSKEQGQIAQPSQSNRISATDFPLPQTQADHNPYAYKPNTLAKELFPEGDRPNHIMQANIDRRRGEWQNTETAQSRNKLARPMSQSFSISSNLPFGPNSRPRHIRRAYSHETNGSTPTTDVTEYHQSPSTAATSVPITSGHSSKRTSAQMATSYQGKAAAIVIGRGRKQNGPSPSQQGAAATDTKSQPAREASTSRRPSRSRSITRGLREYIRPGSTERSRSHSRAPSAHSAVSSASSGVMPTTKARFSWRSWRQSWSSWRENSEDEEGRRERSRGRAEKRRSGDLRKRISVNLNRELPPLPGLDQWKEETEKPKHIANMWNGTIRPKRSMRKEKSSDLRADAAAAKMRSPDPSQIMDLATWPVPARKPSIVAMSGPPSASIQPASASKSPKIPRKPAPISKSPPTDSVLEGQDTGSQPLRTTSTTSIQPLRVQSPTNSAQMSPDLSKISRAAQSPNISSSMFEQPTSASVEDLAKTTGKRRPSRLDLDGAAITTAASPKLYDREVNDDSGETTFVNRNMSVDEYNQMTTSKYKFADDISSLGTPPPVPPKSPHEKKPSKWTWKIRSKKSMTWMDEMEKMGVKDGVLVTDNLNGAPIVRY